jgi:hypothetical protein
MPTADPHAVDVDAILAGASLTAAGPGGAMVVATINVRHLGHFPRIDALPLKTIA